MLVLLGGVMQMSATSYTVTCVMGKGFYAQREYYDGWGDKVKIVAKYYNGSGDQLIADKEMTWITEASSGKHMFYTDLDMDKDLYDAAMGLYGIKIQFNNCYDTWTYSYSEIKDFSKNYIFYIKKGGNFYQEYSTFTYNFAKYNSASNSLSDETILSPSNDVLSTIVDNESSVTETTYALYPSFAKDYGTPLKWELAISPKTNDSDYWVNEFMTYDDDLVHGISSHRGFLVKDVLAKNAFTFDLSSMSFTVSPYRTTNINSTAGYTTWSNGEKYAIDDTNVDDVYVVSADGTSKVTLTSKKGSTFPAGEGVIIKGSGEVKINAVASAATATTIGTNYLVGSGNSEKSDIVATEGKTYVFSWDGTNASSVGFYKASGSGKLAAHKAYLELPSTTPARDFVGFDFGNATGIANVDVNTKFDANAPMYNLAGQRVNKSYKGVVIVNGKKMLNK